MSLPIQIGTPCFQIAFIDVGQGDCTIAYEGTSKAAIVIDCGEGSSARQYLEQLAPDGLSIRMIAITHRHVDHFAGFLELLSAADLSDLKSVVWSPTHNGRLSGDRAR
ncbi:MAG TPA: MBL fold metallo-hydrolase, partial [Armatimonadota bacterium]|nr:MBL fold metallo-hydrolase [Armatimonadota bacterium]